jgi:hypothetical protein
MKLYFLMEFLKSQVAKSEKIMLSTIIDNKGKKYCFYVRNDIYDEIELIITNGKDVWMNADEINERKITYECRPTSRKKESKLSYLNSLKAALIVNPNKIDLPSITKYFYEITVSGEKEETLSLTLKEQLPETSLMTILYKGSYVKKEEEAEGSSSSLMDLLQSLSTVIHDKSSSINDLEKKNNEFASLIQKNTQDIQLLNDLKENLQDTMISKFCLILNEKKKEIINLRRELGEKVVDNTIVGRTSQKNNAMEVDEEEGEDGEGEEMPPLALTTKTKGTRGRKAATTAAVTKAPSKRGAASKKTGLDQIQSKMKKAVTTTSKRITRKKASNSSDDEEEEDDDVEEENGDDDETGDEQQEQPETSKQQQPKKDFSFDHIKKLAKELENKSKSSSASSKKIDDSDDATDDEPIKATPVASSSSFLDKGGKEVDGSQIISFLSSQSQPSLPQQSSSSSSSAKQDKKKKDNDDGDGDDTNDESTSVPALIPAKRPLQGITQQDNKKKKSRRLLDDSDSD